MQPGPLRDRIEAIAANYDIPAEHIYVFDQSKQTKRISANVSGLGPTIRISLNDNLLERTSEPEILAVMGHEMGHYKLNHVWWIVGTYLLIFGLGLFVTSRVAPWLIARHGERWDVREVADSASLPVLAICFSVWMFLMTPATNSLVRVAESQADAFGLDAAHEPDGFAKVAMRLSEYRKIEPGPIEELVFFDHPSGATRVRKSMEWKAKHVANPQIVVPEKGYLDDK
jgi:STE24 endopeptidase